MISLKKHICFLLLFLMFFICGCGDKIQSYYHKDLGNVSHTSSNSTTHTNKQDFSFKGIWVTYSELNMSGLNKTEVEAKLEKIMANIKSFGYTAVFCHIRPFGDAFYPSKYFPYSKYLTGTEGKNPGYDALALMLKAAKKQGIEFHAWINPYRVSSSSTDPSTLSEDNIAATWLTDGSHRAVTAAGGIYYNPSEKDVKKLILNGIKEVVENYKVDGIHFDDYFYPTTLADFDKISYDRYCKNTKAPLSLDDWRRANINSLISSVHRLCEDKGIAFGVSPAGDISTDYTDENYNRHYADVKLWMSTKGYIDYIIPQLYFGYNYPDNKHNYNRLLNVWANIPRHSALKMYIGLGAYKIGDALAKDAAEWCSSDGTLLKRQANDAINNGAKGICVFSYTAAFSQNSINKKEFENLYTYINNTGE